MLSYTMLYKLDFCVAFYYYFAFINQITLKNVGAVHYVYFACCWVSRKCLARQCVVRTALVTACA